MWLIGGNQLQTIEKHIHTYRLVQIHLLLQLTCEGHYRALTDKIIMFSYDINQQRKEIQNSVLQFLSSLHFGIKTHTVPTTQRCEVKAVCKP